MIAEDFVARLMVDIDQKQASLIKSVISGQAGGDRYHAITGEIRGLATAAQLARDLIAPMLDRGHPLLKEEHDKHSHRRTESSAPRPRPADRRGRSFDVLS